MVIGTLVGLYSGFFGGRIDALLMRMTDIALAFPFLIIAIALMAALGSSAQNIVIALAITIWPKFARLMRGQVLQVKSLDYVEAAQASGLDRRRIIFSHVFPNAFPPLIVQVALTIGSTILAAASLSYLGLGVDAAAPDWGLMLSQGKTYLRDGLYLTLVPGIAISFTVLSLNLMADGLRDILDPKV
ncbi:ABC transporter permease [Paenarthrobacter sp. NPDC089675]|uniref:ABC transporter permease n=1 Tax=Paenarthrobacter sp. NPDC089675 TaxID=3364376 RepID=UPI0038162FE8